MPSKGKTKARQHHAYRERMQTEGVAPKSGPGSRPRWTPAEDAMILAAGRPDAIALSVQLGRTAEAIYMRRSKLIRERNER